MSDRDSPSAYEMVGEFIDQLVTEFPETDANELMAALLGGAGHLACIWGLNLEVFKAHSVLAYERAKQVTVEQRTFGTCSHESVVDANGDQN